MIPIRYNVRSLAVRKTSTVATVLGISLVVAVLAASLMLSEGIRRTLRASGKPDVAMVIRKGSDAEISSIVEDPQVGLIKAMPGVAREGNEPRAVAEIVVITTMEKVDGSGVTNVQLRGVPANVRQFRPEARIVAGSDVRPGADEALVGARIRGRLKGLDIGQTFEIRKGRPVTVVGVFADGGSSYESEVWVDFDVVRSSFHREGAVSSVRAALESRSQFEAFEAAVEQDKRMALDAMRETDYYEKQSEGTSMFVSVLGSVVAVLFSVGAMIGAMITMYAAVANRQKEIGVLRALGFSRRSILASFLLESVLLALIGGAFGCCLAFGMRWVKFSMLNFASFSEVVFTFEPTPSIIITSLVFAASMGILGGLFPAVRAARVSPVTAMRGG